MAARWAPTWRKSTGRRRRWVLPRSGRSTISLDLRGVEYLDSAAINVLFEHADRISRIRVAQLLQRGLTISGLDQVIELH